VLGLNSRISYKTCKKGSGEFLQFYACVMTQAVLAVLLQGSEVPALAVMVLEAYVWLWSACMQKNCCLCATGM